MQRSLLLFENSIKSPVTHEKYLYYLGLFIKFYHIKDHDSLCSMKVEQLQIMVEDYIMDLKKRVNPNSVPTYINPIQTFLDVNEVELKWKKIRRLFPAKIKTTGRQAYTNQDIIKMLEAAGTKRNKAIIHFLASTGCRIGALEDLRIRHLTRIEDCYAVLIYEDSIEEYFAFLTPEATKALDEYFDQRKIDKEYMTNENPIFRRVYQLGIEKSLPMTKKALEENVARITKRAGLRVKSLKKGNRFDKMLDHAFRKRFETILKLNKDIPVAVSEKLIGHKAYVDERGNKIQHDSSYVVPEIQQLFKYFKLAIVDLTIDQTEKQRREIQEKQKKIDELKKQQEETLLQKDEVQRNKEAIATMRDKHGQEINDLRAEIEKLKKQIKQN